MLSVRAAVPGHTLYNLIMLIRECMVSRNIISIKLNFMILRNIVSKIISRVIQELNIRKRSVFECTNVIDVNS